MDGTCSIRNSRAAARPWYVPRCTNGCRPAMSAAALAAVQERFAAGEIQVITATSLEIGAALLHRGAA